jgi:hypothetical protein
MQKKLIKILFLATIFFNYASIHCPSIEGTRSANPTYIRTPKIYYRTHSFPTQQAPSRPTMPTHGPMITHSITQPTPLEPHIDAHPTELGDEQILKAYHQEILNDRQKEISGYTHMHGTSDTYNEIELIH